MCVEIRRDFPIWKVADLAGFGGIRAFRRSSNAANCSRALYIILVVMDVDAWPL